MHSLLDDAVYSTVALSPEAFARPDMYLLENETESDVRYIQDALTSLSDRQQKLRVCTSLFWFVYVHLSSCYGNKALVMVRCIPKQFETILLQLKALGYDRKLAKFVVVYQGSFQNLQDGHNLIIYDHTLHFVQNNSVPSTEQLSITL